MAVRAAVLAAATLAAAHPARTQDLVQRTTMDTAASVRLVAERDGRLEPAVVVDAAGAIELPSKLVMVVRPVVYGGSDDWDATLYEAVLRLQRGGNTRWRVDAGYITPPIGIASFDARPDWNPTLLSPSAYGAAALTIEHGVPPIQLLSPEYPLGAQVAASGMRWDARGALTSSSAARAGGAFDGDVAASPNVTAGGGLTPRPGLRVAGAWSVGTYAQASETADGRSRRATLTNVEFDWSGGYGRVYGEWVHGRFERAGPHAVVHAFTLTGVRTLTPRWFVASRLQSLRPPEDGSAAYDRHTYGHPAPSAYGGEGREYSNDEARTSAGWSSEVTIGLRLSPEWTLRTGYIGYRAIGEHEWEHEAGVSLTWSRRWW